MLGSRHKILGLAMLGAALVPAILTSCNVTPPLAPSGAYPTSASTGVSGGRTLKTWTGAFSTSSHVLPKKTAGGVTYKVIDGYVFNMGATNRYFEVDDPFVIIQNSRFMTSGQVSNGSAILQSPPSNKILIVEHSEFDGGRYFQRGIQSDNTDLFVGHSRFHNTGEAAIEKNDFGGRTSLSVTDSYIANDKGWPRGQHVDGIQVGGAKNVTIARNTVLNQPFGGTNGDTSYTSTSALGLWAELGNVTGNVTVDRNLLAGGGRTIYIEQKSPYRFLGTVRITNNRFDTRFGSKASVWGPLYPSGLPARLTWSGNAFSNGVTVSLTQALKNYP